MNEIKSLFGEEVIIHRKKVYNAAHCHYPLKTNNGMINWKLGDRVASNLKCENQPNLKRAI